MLATVRFVFFVDDGLLWILLYVCGLHENFFYCFVGQYTVHRNTLPVNCRTAADCARKSTVL